MTHIVSGFKSKKEFKDAVGANPRNVYVEDPSIFGNGVSGSVEHVSNKLGSFTVTNHPKRSWFASVKLSNLGIVVS